MNFFDLDLDVLLDTSLVLENRLIIACFLKKSRSLSFKTKRHFTPLVERIYDDRDSINYMMHIIARVIRTSKNE